MGKQFKIDPEFKALIPPLLPEEHDALEASILRDGCRDALVVWKGILVDGHNRYEICMKHEKGFRTVELERIDTRESAMAWMIKTQLGRRNINDFHRTTLALKQKQLIAAHAKDRQEAGTNQHSSLSTNLSKAGPVHTRREIAAAAGVSEGTVDKVERIQAHAAPEVIQAVSADHIKIDVAAQIATLPREEQSALAAKGTEALKATAKQIRETKKSHFKSKPATPPARETCVGEIGPATAELEQLRAENAALRTENATLKECIAQLRADLAGMPDMTRHEHQSAGAMVTEVGGLEVATENGG